MKFLENKQDEIIENTLSFFKTKINDNPQATLRQVEGELKSLYIRFDNAWTGRSIVGDTTQMATISGLEGVRAACIERLQQADKEKRRA